jgi:hypothetical protein
MIQALPERIDYAPGADPDVFFRTEAGILCR